MTNKQLRSGGFIVGRAPTIEDYEQLMRPTSELVEEADRLSAEADAIQAGRPRLDPKRIYAHWNKRPKRT